MSPSTPVELVLPTSMDSVRLSLLTLRDAPTFFRLVEANRDHLRQFGNYTDLAGSTLEGIEGYFVDPPDNSLRMGIWVSDELAGRVDLNPVAPGTFVLGYWLGLSYTGRGYATASCRAILEYGRNALGAHEFWAGITHGNRKSVGVIGRLGFTAVEALPDRTRFRLAAQDCRPTGPSGSQPSAWSAPLLTTDRRSCGRRGGTL